MTGCNDLVRTPFYVVLYLLYSFLYAFPRRVSKTERPLPRKQLPSCVCLCGYFLRTSYFASRFPPPEVVV